MERKTLEAIEMICDPTEPRTELRAPFGMFMSYSAYRENNFVIATDGSVVFGILGAHYHGFRGAHITNHGYRNAIEKALDPKEPWPKIKVATSALRAFAGRAHYQYPHNCRCARVGPCKTCGDTGIIHPPVRDGYIYKTPYDKVLLARLLACFESKALTMQYGGPRGALVLKTPDSFGLLMPRKTSKPLPNELDIEAAAA